MRQSQRIGIIGLSVVLALGVAGPVLAASIPAFSEWTSALGDWQSDGDTLTNTDTETSSTNAYAPLSQSGSVLTYSWTVAFHETNVDFGPAAGLHVLGDADSEDRRGNSYMVWQEGGGIILYKIAGGLTRLANIRGFEARSGEAYSYRFVINTATGELSVYRDNQLVTTHMDPVPLTSGEYISARTNGTAATFSDIEFSVSN